MQNTSHTLPIRGQISPACADGEKIERAALVPLEAV